MGREIRRVPADWNPGDRAHYDQSFVGAFAEWHRGLHQWLKGTHPDQKTTTDYPEMYEATVQAYTEWDGRSPDPEYCRPAWTDEERTHYMLYETVSEGSAMSPAFATTDELIEWMLKNPDPVWGRRTREQCEALVHYGSAPSMVLVGGQLLPGDKALAKIRAEEST